MKKLILLITIGCICFEISFSQPGKLDPSFGSDGIVKSDLGTPVVHGDRAEKVFFQEDGSMYAILSANFRYVISKRLSNGSIDINYGKNGFSPIDFYFSESWNAAIQEDGKIVVTGLYDFSSDDSHLNIVRYNTAGALDSTFSEDGKQMIDFSPFSVAIQSNGKIVVGGTTEYPSYNVILARYNEDGTPDTTFSEDGKQSTNFASPLAIQPDGKIVAAGSISINGKPNITIVRYNINGTLDTTFSEDGKVTTDLQSASKVVIQSDGKIVVGGANSVYVDSIDNYETDFVLVRCNTDGSLDTSFSDDGKQSTDVTGGQGLILLAIQKDGKIVAAGLKDIARYDKEGSLDKTFDGDGLLTIEMNENELFYSVALQHNEKIMLAGTLDHNASLFVRYNSDGSLDETWDGDGRLIDTTGIEGATTYTSNAIQKDGKMVAAGSTWDGKNLGFILARYNTDGSLDSTFGSDGVAFGSEATYAGDVVVQQDGKILASVYKTSPGNSNFFLVRYSADGKRDSTFDGDGIKNTDIRFTSLSIQNDGKIVGVGAVGTSSSPTAFARYNEDGTLDTNFSGDGKQTTDFSANSVAIQSDGKIVLAGSTYYPYKFAVARYNSNGSPDNTFGNAGKVTTQFPLEGIRTSAASSLAIQDDGKIVVGGTTSVIIVDVAEKDFALARYNADGSLDTAFSGDGLQSTEFTYGSDATSVAIQKDGKIVLGGGIETYFESINYDFALARYNTNGSPDSTFSEDGKQTTNVNAGLIDPVSVIRNIVISDDKLYALGAAKSIGYLGVVARYLLDNESENNPPTVSLSIPYNIVKYSAPARIKLNASATDKDGTITKVQFYNGTTLLHTEVESPYGFLWINVPVGTYTLTAKAFDNSGNETTSNSIEVSVVDENVPPVVRIVSPANDTTYTGPATIQIIAEAKDPNDRISKVEFYNGTTLLRTEYYYPYRYRWTNVQPGTYTITAKAYDDKGFSATSEPVTVTVTNAPIVRSKPSSVNNKTDINSALSLRLSPNPAGSTLQIFTNGLQFNKPSTISVISASGAALKTIQSNASNKVVQLDISSLVRGVYIIKVMSGKKVLYKQFVKL